MKGFGVAMVALASAALGAAATMFALKKREDLDQYRYDFEDDEDYFDDCDCEDCGCCDCDCCDDEQGSDDDDDSTSCDNCHCSDESEDPQDSEPEDDFAKKESNVSGDSEAKKLDNSTNTVCYTQEPAPQETSFDQEK